MPFELKNLKNLELRLKSLTKEMKDRGSASALEGAEKLVTRIKSEFVPFDEGRLSDSVQVDKAALQQGRSAGGQFTSGAAIEIKITAGGDNLPYAIAVHETPSDHDPPTWKGKTVKFTVGGSKYIERPLNEDGPKIIQDAMKAMFED